MLPDFLNIGVARCGTTWLHELLDTHPDVFVPQKRKEIHFFCHHYEEGLGWYERFFPDARHSYEAIGEVAVHYLLTHEQSAPRIAEVDTIKQLIVMLRDPVERAWSHYHWTTDASGSSVPLRKKTEEVPMIIESGFYATGLKSFMKYFNPSDLLILKSKEAFQHVSDTKQRLAHFLGIDARKFPEEAGKKKVRSQRVPRFERFYNMANRISYRLRMGGVDWLSNAIKRMGAKRLLMSDQEKEKGEIPKKDVRWMASLYEEEMRELERTFGVDTSDWRESWNRKLSR